MTTVYQYGQGDNYLGDVYLGDKIGKQSVTTNTEQKLPVDATTVIIVKLILDELSETFNPNSRKGQQIISTAALSTVDNMSELKDNLIKCLKDKGMNYLVIAIDHPASRLFIESFIEKYI